MAVICYQQYWFSLLLASVSFYSSYDLVEYTGNIFRLPGSSETASGVVNMIYMVRPSLLQYVICGFHFWLVQLIINVLKDFLTCIFIVEVLISILNANLVVVAS